jgi:hypothetical protein
MMITKHNYEGYMLDWMEGNLSSKEVAALQRFLADHPELDAELPDEIVFHESDGLTQEEKQSLLFESVDKRNRGYFFAAYVENQLTPKQEAELTVFLASNPEFKTEFEQFNKTIIPADLTIVYTDKNLLLQPVSGTFGWNQLFRAAAVVVIILTVGYSLFTIDSPSALYVQSTLDDTQKEMDSEIQEVIVPRNDEVNQIASLPGKSVFRVGKSVDNEVVIAEGSIEKEDKNMKGEINGSIPKTFTPVAPNNENIALSTVESKEESGSKNIPSASSEAVPVQDWAFSAIERRAREALDFPEDVRFENGIFSLTSLGLTALTGQQQEIGKKDDLYRKTKVEFAGVKFERVVRR